MKAGAQLFSYLKQLLKLYTRQRDKAMMLSIIEEVSGMHPPLPPRADICLRIARYPPALPGSIYNLLRALGPRL
jgi:hypothetical protein